MVDVRPSLKCQEQKKIQDDFKIVEDSLYALAKRVVQIESFITEKVGDIKGNMRKGLDHLEERQKPQAQEQQQRAMTNLNDLALMLSEVMQTLTSSAVESVLASSFVAIAQTASSQAGATR